MKRIGPIIGLLLLAGFAWSATITTLQRLSPFGNDRGTINTNFANLNTAIGESSNDIVEWAEVSGLIGTGAQALVEASNVHLKASADSRYVNVTGDETMAGNLTATGLSIGTGLRPALNFWDSGDGVYRTLDYNSTNDWLYWSGLHFMNVSEGIYFAQITNALAAGSITRINSHRYAGFRGGTTDRSPLSPVDLRHNTNGAFVAFIQNESVGTKAYSGIGIGRLPTGGNYSLWICNSTGYTAGTQYYQQPGITWLEGLVPGGPGAGNAGYPMAMCSYGIGGDLMFFVGGTHFVTNRAMTILNPSGFIGIGLSKTNPATALDVAGTVTATAFSGNGSGLTNLPAANIAAGGVASAFDGSGLTNMALSQITDAGTMAARATGDYHTATASNGRFLGITNPVPVVGFMTVTQVVFAAGLSIESQAGTNFLFKGPGGKTASFAW